MRAQKRPTVYILYMHKYLSVSSLARFGGVRWGRQQRYRAAGGADRRFGPASADLLAAALPYAYANAAAAACGLPSSVVCCVCGSVQRGFHVHVCCICVMGKIFMKSPWRPSRLKKRLDHKNRAKHYREDNYVLKAYWWILSLRNIYHWNFFYLAG